MVGGASTGVNVSIYSEFETVGQLCRSLMYWYSIFELQYQRSLVSEMAEVDHAIFIKHTLVIWKKMAQNRSVIPQTKL